MGTTTTTIRIQALDDASAVFRKLGRSASALSSRLNKVGTMAQLAGFRVSAAIGYPAIRAAKGMLTVATTYEAAVNKLSGVAVVQRSALASSEKAAKSLAKTTIFTATEIVAAQYELVQSGLTLAQSQAALAPTLQLATLAQIDLAQAASKTTDVMLGYGLQVKDLSRINDILAFQSTKSNTTVVQLADAFRYAGPVAQAVGISFEKTAAMLGVLADAGFKGSQGGTALRTIMLRLISPTARARAALQSLNIDISKFSSLKAPVSGKGLAGFIAAQGLASTQELSKLVRKMDKIVKKGGNGSGQAINDLLINELGLTGVNAKAANGMLTKYLTSISDGLDVSGLFKALKKSGASAAQLNDIFGVRRTAQAVTLMQKMDKALKQTVKNINDSAGSAAVMADKMMLGPDGAIKRLQAALENLALSFWSSGLGDAVLQFINGLRSTMNYISSLSDKTKMMIAKWALFAAATGPLLIYLGLVTQGIGALIGGFSLISKAITGVIPLVARLSAALVRIPFATASRSVVGLISSLGSLVSIGRIAMASPLVLMGTAAFFAISRAISMTSKTLGRYSPMVIAWKNSISGIFSSSYSVITRFLMGDVAGARSARKKLTYELEQFRATSTSILREIGSVAIPAIFGKANAAAALTALNKIAVNVRHAFDLARAAISGFSDGFSKAFKSVPNVTKLIDAMSKAFADGSTSIVEFVASITGIDATTASISALAESIGKMVGSNLSALIDKVAPAIRAIKAAAIEATPYIEKFIAALAEYGSLTITRTLWAVGKVFQGIAKASLLAYTNTKKLIALIRAGFGGKKDGMFSNIDNRPSISGGASIQGLDVAEAKFAAIAGSLYLLSTRSKLVSAVFGKIGLALVKPLALITGMRLPAIGLGAALSALGRVFLSPKSMGIFALTTALIELSNQWDNVGPAIKDGMTKGFESISNLDIGGAASGFGEAGKKMLGVLGDALVNKQVLAMIGASVIFNLSGGIMKKMPSLRATAAFAARAWSLAFQGGKLLLSLAGAIISIIARGAWAVAGAAAGALWGGGFNTSSKIGTIVTNLIGKFNSGKWGSAGYSAGSKYGRGLKRAIGVLSAVSIMAQFENVSKDMRDRARGLIDAGMSQNDALLQARSEKAARTSAKFDKFIAPVTTGAKERWKVASDNFKQAYADAFAKVKSLLSDLYDTFAKIGDKIVTKFKAVGTMFADAIKTPLAGIADWFIGKFNTVIGAINKARSALGYDAISLLQTNASKQAMQYGPQPGDALVNRVIGPTQTLPFNGGAGVAAKPTAYGPPAPTGTAGVLPSRSSKGTVDDLAAAIAIALKNENAKTSVNIKVTADKTLNVTGSSISSGPMESTLDIGESNMIPY